MDEMVEFSNVYNPKSHLVPWMMTGGAPFFGKPVMTFRRPTMTFSNASPGDQRIRLAVSALRTATVSMSKWRFMTWMMTGGNPMIYD